MTNWRVNRKSDVYKQAQSAIKCYQQDSDDKTLLILIATFVREFLRKHQHDDSPFCVLGKAGNNLFKRQHNFKRCYDVELIKQAQII